MIATAFVVAVVLVFVGSFVWDRVRKRRHQRLALRSQHGEKLVDGVASPAAVEGGLRSGYHTADGGGPSGS